MTSTSLSSLPNGRGGHSNCLKTTLPTSFQVAPLRSLALGTSTFHAMLAHALLCLLILTRFLDLAYASAQCYYVDGTPSPTDVHQPCFPENSVSACCVLDSGNDVCLSSGLCMTNSGQLYQGACTDSSYTSANCSHFCPDRKSDYVGFAIMRSSHNMNIR